MFVPFETLPDTARIWIYQSNKLFTADEHRIISDTLSSFTQSWVAHGSPLKTSFDIPHDHFIVLAADEDYHGASGCSIDSSVRVICQLATELGIDFLDRSSVAFMIDDKINMIPVNQLKSENSLGRWDGQTPVFNNLVESKGQLSRWLVPAETTWLKRYLSGQAVSN